MKFGVSPGKVPDICWLTSYYWERSIENVVCYLLKEQPSIYVIYVRCLNYILHSNQLVPQSQSA